MNARPMILGSAHALRVDNVMLADQNLTRRADYLSQNFVIRNKAHHKNMPQSYGPTPILLFQNVMKVILRAIKLITPLINPVSVWESNQMQAYPWNWWTTLKTVSWS